MRVLMQSRKTLFTVPGGDTIQIVENAEKLKELGIHVDISTELTPKLDNYDIVHIFNIVRPQEVYLQALNAKKQGKPIVLTPIYVCWEEYEKFGSDWWRKILANIFPYHSIEYLKVLARAIKNGEIHKGVLKLLLKGYFTLMEKVVRMTDIFLPNSEMEMDKLKKDFRLHNPKYIIVPNGINHKIFDFSNVNVEKKIESNIKDSILCVANINGLKNQLNLVKAMKNLPYKLFLIGDISPNHRNYYKKIINEKGDNVFYIGKISHRELPQYYKVAKVHVLPSWFETTGLVSLEAAVMRCNIVVTDKGFTKSYFGDYAFYCNPNDIDSIKDAIINAYESPFNEDFREYILSNFTLEISVKKIIEGYKKVL